METLISLSRIAFDPIILGGSIVVAWGTILLLRLIYCRDNSYTFFERLAVAYESCEFEATAGGRIYNYVDADKLVMGSPDILDELSNNIVKILNKYPKAIACFVEMDSGPVGMLSMQSLITMKLNKPTSVIRLRKDVTQMSIKGRPISKGDKVVILQDVFRTGFHVVKAANVMEKFGASVIATVALVDREEERELHFVDKGIALHSIIPLSTIQKHYNNNNPTEEHTSAAG